MAHAGGFGMEVILVLGTCAHDDGDAVHHIDAELRQLVPLVGIVGHELNGLNAHGVEHLRSKIIPRIS